MGKNNIILLVFFLLDRLIKEIVRNSGYYFIINTGISFSFFEGFQVFNIIISYIILLLLLFFYIGKGRFSYGLILIGGVSNFLDRFFYSGVLDYISIWIFPVFNISDIFIVIGIVVMISEVVFNKSGIKNEEKI